MEDIVWSKEKFLCIIHDKMDHVKIILPRLQRCKKMISRLRQLPITLTCMVTHGHGFKKYVQYLNELWPNNLNFTIGFLSWLCYTLEIPPISEWKLLFEKPPQISIFACILWNENEVICWVLGGYLVTFVNTLTLSKCHPFGGVIAFKQLEIQLLQGFIVDRYWQWWSRGPNPTPFNCIHPILKS
jgi:hypothetical protein